MVRDAKLQTLTAEFDHLKMKDNDTINDFFSKISELFSRSAALGETMEESKLVKKFLKSLPRKKYIHMVASLQQLLDLKETSFEDVIGRLKAYEERIHEEEEDGQSDQNKLMYANSDTPKTQSSGDFRGKGQGGRFCGRGRGRGRFYRDIYFSKVTCFRCHKFGDFASSCPGRLLKLQEVYERKTEETR